MLRRRAQRRHTSFLIGSLLLSAAAGVIVAAVRLASRPPTSGADGELSVLAWLVITAPLLLILLLLVALVRLQRQDRLSSLPGPSLALGADRATRRRVGRSLRRGDLPADEPDRSLVLDAARRTVAYRWSRVVFLLGALVQAANAFVQDEPLLRALAVSTAVILLAAVAQQSVLVSRARQILRPGSTVGSACDGTTSTP